MFQIVLQIKDRLISISDHNILFIVCDSIEKRKHLMDYFRAQDLQKFDVFTSEIASSSLVVSEYIYLLGMLKGTFDDSFEQKVTELTEKYHIPSNCVMNKLSPDMQLLIRVMASIAGNSSISVIDDVKELITMENESPLSHMITKYITERKTAIIISGKEPPRPHNAVCY